MKTKPHLACTRQAARLAISAVVFLAGISLVRPDTAAAAPAAGEQPARQKRLHLTRRSPFYPRFGDRPLLLIGCSDRDALTLWQTEKGFDWRRYLNTLAEHGFNYVRQNATAWTGLSVLHRYPAQFSHPLWAFPRAGPGVAVDGQLRFDLTRFEEGYFLERLIPFLQEAERRGIIVELTLFDDCRRRRALADSL